MDAEPPFGLPRKSALSKLHAMFIRQWLCIALASSAFTCGAEEQTTLPPRPDQSRLGINLSGPADWNTEHPFVDVFRLSRAWISQRKGEAWGKGPQLDRDAQGWIKRLEPDCWAETPVLTAGHAPSGEYVCLYEGAGEIGFSGNAKITSSSPGRIVVDIDGHKGGVFLQLRKTDPQNPVRNIRVVMPGFEKTFREEPFHPAFLDRWRGFNTFRFMDWQQTNGSTQRDWTDRPTPESCNFTERGVPMEVMVALCNKLKVNPWFCMPHLATDDYVRQFAMLVKRTLDPSLIVHVEYSNEVWNRMFAQTGYAEERGMELGFAKEPWEAGWRFSSYRSVQIHRIWEQAFGGRQRLIRVIASQSAVPFVSEQKLSFQDAAKSFDALAIAPYFGFNVPADGGKDTPGAEEVSQWPMSRLLDHVETRSLPRAVAEMAAQRKVAGKFGVRLVCYEAGQHLVGVGGAENNETLTQLLIEANRHPRMGAFYTHYLDEWKTTGGGDLCVIFSSVGQSSKWGSWCLLEGATETNSPKFDAVMEWNRRNHR